MGCMVLVSGVVAMALGLTAANIWEPLWRGWDLGRFEREQSWQMLSKQWFLNLPRMQFLFLEKQERGFYFREGLWFELE